MYPGTDSRKVTLTSSSSAAMDAAQSLLLLSIAQAYPDTFLEVGVVVPESCVGRVIGRGGARIAKLRELCLGCDMQAADGSGERMLIVSGDVIQMTRTVRQVFWKCDSPSINKKGNEPSLEKSRRDEGVEEKGETINWGA
jgi:predicted RNA-binding protein YlqC (UPF0109 family)